MQENSKMRGLTPHLMIVDEVADIDAVESSGESALSEVAETQPQFSKNQPALHKKAVEKRRKRKRGGHK